MKVLITGGTGLIGAKVARKLIEMGIQPVLFDSSTDLSRLRGVEESVTLVRGNVVNIHELVHAVREHGVDRILHLAYMMGTDSNRDPLSATYVNVIGTVNAYETGRICGLERVCVASSIAVFGSDEDYSPGELPLVESSKRLMAMGIPVYSAGKLYAEVLGEHYRERFGVFVCGLRPGIVYGYGRFTGATAFISELILKPAKGEPVKVDNGDMKISLVYVDDVAEQFVALLTKEKSEIKCSFYNSGGDTLTISELAEAVRRVVPGADITVSPGSVKYASGLAASVSGGAIEKELGVRRVYTPVERGIEKMIEEMEKAEGKGE